MSKIVEYKRSSSDRDIFKYIAEGVDGIYLCTGNSSYGKFMYIPCKEDRAKLMKEAETGYPSFLVYGSGFVTSIVPEEFMVDDTGDVYGFIITRRIVRRVDTNHRVLSTISGINNFDLKDLEEFLTYYKIPTKEYQNFIEDSHLQRPYESMTSDQLYIFNNYHNSKDFLLYLSDIKCMLTFNSKSLREDKERKFRSWIEPCAQLYEELCRLNNLGSWEDRGIVKPKNTDDISDIVKSLSQIANDIQCIFRHGRGTQRPGEGCQNIFAAKTYRKLEYLSVCVRSSTSFTSVEAFKYVLNEVNYEQWNLEGSVALWTFNFE